MPKIMIADDDVSIQMELEEYLTHMGHTVVGTADAGAEAVEMVREMKPDLILMDINLPGEMDGISAAQKIKEDMDVAVVFVTGFDDPEYIERAKLVEPFGYVMKPFDEKEINGNIEIALHKRKLELALKKANEQLEHTNRELKQEIEERKQTEKALRTSQQHLSQIINFLPDATFVIDNEKKVVAWNQAIEDMTGVKAEEILGKGDYEYAIPFYGERRPTLIDLASEWNKEIEAKYKYVKKEGGSLVTESYDPLIKPGGFLWGKASLLYDHNGKVIGAIESIRDITDMKTAEEALRESEKRFRSLFEQAPEGIFLHDLEGRFKDVNRAGCESLGYHKEELLKLDVRDIDPDAVERSDKERFWKDIVNNEPINFEARHQHKDGSFFPIEVSLNPVQFGAQRLILAITRDISERKAAEEALQESETRYREFVEGTDDLITKADKDGKFIFVNHMSNRIFGLAPQDCIGKLAFGFVHPDDRERTRKWLYEKIATHKIRGIIENRQVSQSGEIHHMLWTANFHYDNDGNLINVNGIARDIANRKQAEEALQKAHVGLEQEVEERTSELSKKNEQLREEIRDRKKTEEILKEREKDLGGKRIRLEELNGALKILLEKRDEDRKELEEKVMVNVKEMVLPYVAKLKSTGLGALQETFTDIIESNLDAIISPFLRKLSSKYLNLTPTEIRVADLVKQGLSTKEIGNLLNSSPETISRHRKSIRKKLQLKDKKSNLRTHLLSLQ